MPTATSGSPSWKEAGWGWAAPRRGAAPGGGGGRRRGRPRAWIGWAVRRAGEARFALPHAPGEDNGSRDTKEEEWQDDGFRLADDGRDAGRDAAGRDRAGAPDLGIGPVARGRAPPITGHVPTWFGRALHEPARRTSRTVRARRDRYGDL